MYLDQRKQAHVLANLLVIAKIFDGMLDNDQQAFLGRIGILAVSEIERFVKVDADE